GEARRLGVGGVVRERVDGRTLGIPLAPRQRVAVQRYEQLRPMRACGLDTVRERHKRVVAARHLYLVFADPLDLVPQHQGEIEHHGFLSLSGWSVRPFVDAAVARIKDDYGARIIA